MSQSSDTQVPLLEFAGVHAHYGPVEALKAVNVHISAGEIVSLIGANGAGKTTLLSSIFGAPRVSSGKILHRGEDISQMPTSRISRRGIALVPEGRQIYQEMSVEENMMMGTTPIGMAHFEEDRNTMFELFPRLKERRNQTAGTMSGGEQQMLAIARAMMARPELILFDEPSLGLAPLIVKRVFEVLREIAAMGKTIFLVEQNANHALKLSQRAYVMVNGRIHLSGESAALPRQPRRPQSLSRTALNKGLSAGHGHGQSADGRRRLPRAARRPQGIVPSVRANRAERCSKPASRTMHKDGVSADAVRRTYPEERSSALAALHFHRSKRLAKACCRAEATPVSSPRVQQYRFPRS
ncbi:ABC-type branched-subunit amino acid transport system ATPase component [Rhizobium leguminosarum]